MLSRIFWAIIIVLVCNTFMMAVEYHALGIIAFGLVAVIGVIKVFREPVR